MPAYTYRCECGHKMEIITRMRDHDKHWPCSKCGNLAGQVIETPPMLVIPEHMRWNAQAYTSPIDDRPITTHKARIEDMARNNCMEYEPGMRQDVDRRVIEADEAMDKAIDATIDKEISTMPVRKLERLDSELMAGMTPELLRM